MYWRPFNADRALDPKSLVCKRNGKRLSYGDLAKQSPATRIADGINLLKILPFAALNQFDG
ncbi:MAG: hypothetical protein QW808_03075 [Desulfurococcaceae archaeon]